MLSVAQEQVHCSKEESIKTWSTNWTQSRNLFLFALDPLLLNNGSTRRLRFEMIFTYLSYETKVRGW